MNKTFLLSLLIAIFSVPAFADTNPQANEVMSREQLKQARREARNATTTSDVVATKKRDNQQQLNKKWQHALPFYAQNAIDLGFDLPLPFSLSLIPTYTQQIIGFNNLNVKVGDVSLGDVVNLDDINFGNRRSIRRRYKSERQLGCFHLCR